MARIRSIKPEFFTSETIATLPISARLTFIGLWTHVDDNGVAIDNDRLIAAAIWPLEDDPLETLRSVSGDLRRLSTAGLIQRYESAGRRYLYVVSWDEHQRVSHPSKPRYPRPDAPGTRLFTSENEPLPKSSGGSPESLQSPPEILVPEQGAGSREQGAGSREHVAPQATPSERTPKPDPAAFDAFWAAYPRKVAKGAARTEWDKAIKKGADPDLILAGARRYRDDPDRQRSEPKFTAHPATWLHGQRWFDERPSRPPGGATRTGPYREQPQIDPDEDWAAGL